MGPQWNPPLPGSHIFEILDNEGELVFESPFPEDIEGDFIYLEFEDEKFLDDLPEYVKLDLV